MSYSAVVHGTSILMAIALVACSSDPEIPPPGICTGCEYLVHGEPLQAQDLESDGERLYVLKFQTREIYRYPLAGGGAEFLAEVPGASSMVVGSSVIWVPLGLDGGLVVLDKLTGHELARSDSPGSSNLDHGPGGQPILAVQSGLTKRLVVLDEALQESAVLWEQETDGYFEAIAGDETAIAWILATSLGANLYLLPTGVSMPTVVDMRAAGLGTGGDLTVANGAAHVLMGGDGTGSVARVGSDGTVTQLGEISGDNIWLTPTTFGFVGSGYGRTLSAIGSSGESLRSVELPFAPNIWPTADGSFIYVSGETDLLRVALSTFE
ncbi:MAG TPA: hypothetical protein VGP93_15830 [Polyangiaceae bacterium]|nr:hypothetical protein [Polyangiaceae bacterium]